MRKLEKKANDLLNNIFYFDRPWDMEQDLTAIEMKIIDWGYQMEDPEWTYMLNRMEYIVDVSVYALISEQSKYIVKVEELIMDWIAQNIALEQTYHRTLDTGLRLLSWSFALKNLYISNDHIADSIKTQVIYLQKHYRLKDDLSNWGLLQSIGVLACSEYLDQKMIEWWTEKLYLQLELQINDDGFHWENSILYHNQILLGLCRLQDVNKNLKLKSYIDDLAISTYRSCKPNYHQIQQNDSDDTDVSGLLAYAYTITHNEHYQFDLLDSRLGVLCLSNNVIKPKLKDVTKFFKNSGLSVVRNENLFMSAHNHPYGSSHSHLMWGHVNFYSSGDILIDPGRYTYVDTDIRKQLKSIESHNCAFNQSIYKENIQNSWDTIVNAYPISTEKYNKENIDVTIINYSVNDMINTRYVILIGKQLLIFDRVKQYENEVIEANLVFDYNVKFNDLSLTNRNYKIVHNYQSWSKLEQKYSPKYNELKEVSKLKFISPDQKIINYLCLIEKAYNMSQIYIDDTSVAYRLESKEDSYIIYLCPIEIKVGTKVKSVYGHSLYGKLIIINEETGMKYNVKI